jgi:hypothetical protein
MKPCGNTFFYRDGKTSVIEWVRCVGCRHASINQVRALDNLAEFVHASPVLHGGLQRVQSATGGGIPAPCAI